VARRELTGALLVGGASTRFGSPKAFAAIGGESLAQRGWRVLGELCDERLAVGKASDGLAFPFPLLDDGTDVRAPIAGVVAALLAAAHDVCVVLPVDCPRASAALLATLADACAGDVDVAVPQTGPLPGAYRFSAFLALERRLRTGELALRDALAELDVVVVEWDPRELANVNTPDDLRSLR
jgi:molybdopterin-guanine dinucleotide biosynthesis protein A